MTVRGPEPRTVKVYYMEIKRLIDVLTERYQEILGDNFVGLYVHGSYAMSGFNPLKSDLDYIIVCSSVPDIAVKKAIMDTTIAFERMAPAKGLEMHLMLRESCAVVSWPPRFELHYSVAHTSAYLNDPDGFIGRMHGEDPDLGAHLAVLKARGFCAAGADISKVFGVVPKEYYIESILSDLGWSEGDRMYHVLNHCRTLAYAVDGGIRSKKEGAEWALEHLPEEHHEVIREALRCYEGGDVFSSSDEARAFCEKALCDIKNLLGLSQT